MSRRLDLSRQVPRRRPLPANITDAQWWADATERYEEYWREFIGSPETFAAGANWFYLSTEFGAAALFYQKAIDLLHTLYCIDDLRRRQPSPVDLPIVEGYLSSLGASLSLHPDAPMGNSVAEVAHRLEDIRATCKSAGISTDPYRQALVKLERYARRFGVDINTAVLAEPKATVINNQGIMASGNAVVSGSAVASGYHAQAVVAGTSEPTLTPQQIISLLRQLMGELSRTGHTDRAELIEAADEACQELASPRPRLARLKILAHGLASAVGGVASLASLATQIEQAIHGL